MFAGAETESAVNKQIDDLNLNVKGLPGAQVYGQGMTVSAMEAEALHNLLKVRSSPFACTAKGHGSPESALTMMFWLFLHRGNLTDTRNCGLCPGLEQLYM